MEDWRKHAGVPDVRTMEDLKPVFRDPRCGKTGPAYLMFRDVSRSPGDREWLSKNQLRFDVTCIPPADLCGEFVKTKGHYHPENPAGTGYPEAYQVLSGTAHFLLQSRDLRHVCLVPAGRGDTVIVPPGFGHVTINPEKETLVMANIVASCFESDYRFYEEHRGAAYYELVTCELEKNPLYPGVPPVRRLEPPGITGKSWPPGPLYELVEGRSGILRALVHPEEYPQVFSPL